jgi:hypothetical protein
MSQASPSVDLGLRAAGAALLVMLWPVGAYLTAIVHTATETTPAAFIIGCLCVVSGSSGMALLIAGSRLFARVTISRRWS